MNIELNSTGVLIDGEYKTLLCSSLFYFRIPKEKWEERILLLKAAGYNTVDVYCPWNYHETEQGFWDFSGQRDIEEFLQLLKLHNLYVIIRPGPYICSEWDGGALPAWLNLNPEIIRQDNPQFLNVILTWYEQILSKIKPFLITNSGSIIMMQIENELDFFDCKSPSTYVGKLRKYAMDMGIDVPLFCCCGQNNIERSGSLDMYLKTTFNVYSEPDNNTLEERLYGLYHSMQSKNLPLLVTETNREHSYLKRLFICGAKLLSPYNQTAGTTAEYYNGITNWGSTENPIALMASDYDFSSMIGSAGDLSSEFYESRLFASLLLCLGEYGAKAVPYAYSECKEDGKSLPSLKTEIGSFILVSNLHPDAKSKFIDFDGVKGEIFFDGLESKILPFNLKLNDSVTVKFSNCEIVYFSEINSKLQIIFAANTGCLDAVLLINGNEKRIKLENEFFELDNIEILFGKKEYIAQLKLGKLPSLKIPIENQKEVNGVKSINRISYAYNYTNIIETEIKSMEELGQYRGVGSYRCDIPETSDVLLQNISDIVIEKKDSSFIQTYFSNGSSIVKKLEKGSYEWICEIWGHSNFNDITEPSLKMNSLKGISGISLINHRYDITDNWNFDFDNQFFSDSIFFNPSPNHAIVDIDNYISSKRPFRGLYHKSIQLNTMMGSDDDKVYLFFEKPDCIINVYINGNWIALLPENDHYLDISDFVEGNDLFDLVLRIERLNYAKKIGIVELVVGSSVKKCTYSKLMIEPKDIISNQSLPLQLNTGDECIIHPDFFRPPANDAKLKFDGSNMRLTVFYKGRCIGRHVLKNNKFPVTAGGPNNICMICKEWFDEIDQLFIYCQAIDDGAVLENIELLEFRPVI